MRLESAIMMYVINAYHLFYLLFKKTKLPLFFSLTLMSKQRGRYMKVLFKEYKRGGKGK
jgi:hypothetical protein